MDPLGENPWWTLLVAALPALLCTILIFMDQQITAVIINRKEHKLKVRFACWDVLLVMFSLFLHEYDLKEMRQKNNTYCIRFFFTLEN